MLGGIDVGTTGCKITIYDNDGTLTYQAYRDYPVTRAGEHEVQASAIWQGVQEVIKDAASHCKNIQAIGITSFGESCVLLDEKDEPILPVMLYTDIRGKEQSEYLADKIGSEYIEQVTGVHPHEMYSLPKVMWIKEHRPEEFAKTKHICMMEDYVIYMLTGNAVIDYSLAARSLGFNIHKLEWSNSIFEAAGIDKNLFSKPVISGTKAGTVKKELAEALGLAEDVVIVPVGHDQVAAAIGSGVFEKGTGIDGAGTVECIAPLYEGIPEGRTMAEGGYAVIPYVIPGHYVTYAFSYAGGALISWYIQNFAKYEKQLAKESGKSVYEILEQDMKDEPTGILVLPHIAGAATPYMDMDAKGAITGLTISHNASDVYRAMMEGVCYEMVLNMEWLEEAGIRPGKLRATGGGASSKVWMQMKADMLNVPIVSLGNAEAGAVGCAMMAGIATGVFKDLQDAAGVMITEGATYYPRKEQHEAYMKHYDRYRELYKAVRPLS